MIDALPLGLLVLAAFGAGVVDAIAGGGGLITVPALLAAGLPPHVALGTNKGQSMWGAAASLTTYWRQGAVDLRFVAVGLPLGALGATLGALAVTALSPSVLRPVVMVLLVAASLSLWVKRPTTSRADTVAAWIAPALALGIGAYDGFFGPGTGTFLIVGLVLFAGRTLPTATAQAKAVNLGSNLAAVVVFAAHGMIAFEVALPMAAAQLVGGVVGARLALRGGAALIRVVVLMVSTALLIKLGVDIARDFG